MTISEKLINSAADLKSELKNLSFSEPVSYVYNPLDYAWPPFKDYRRKYGNTSKKIIFMGMNPGPWGMAQTGVPFGEIEAVRDWMGIEGDVTAPEKEHPKRKIEGFDCARSEVSGKRLWGLFKHLYPNPADFFADHFVINYCPLIFMEESSRNRTPDKLPVREQESLFAACDKRISEVITILEPDWCLGVGKFAEKQLLKIAKTYGGSWKKMPKIDTVLHPSPASPIANRGWAPQAAKKLVDLGIWDKSVLDDVPAM